MAKTVKDQTEEMIDQEGANREVEVLDPEETGVSQVKLLGFYDRLRERITATVERKQGKLGQKAVRALLAVPDTFLLLVRLVLDKETPKETRALIGGALAYFILPIDLFPEGFVGPVGFTEDIVFAAAVLSSAFDRRLEGLVQRHWSGSEDLRVLLQDLLEGAQALLGKSLYGRLRRVLARRGITLSAS